MKKLLLLLLFIIAFSYGFFSANKKASIVKKSDSTVVNILGSKSKDQSQLLEKSRLAKELLAKLEANRYEEKLILSEIDPTPTVSLVSDRFQQILDGDKNIAQTYQAAKISMDNDLNTGLLTENPIKTTYTIALLGDSMVDTLGADVKQLKNSLLKNFPAFSFALLNFGQGSTDLENGLKRLTNNSTYLGKNYQAVLSFKPDILIVESFAYNHWSSRQYDLDRQWLTYAKIVDTVKANSPSTKIIFATSIAPNPAIYGDGSVNLPKDQKWERTQTIKKYLQNLINFAQSQNFPLADAYSPSLDSNGHGQIKYIDAYDHIHPSEAGIQLFSDKIVEAIVKYKIIAN